MDTLVLKVVLTPALIAAVSMAGRRWGSVVSGWLVGLPFTSAPIIFFLALNQGAPFAAATATSTLAGGFSEVAFCLTYAWLAWRGGWLWAILGGSFAFVLSTFALHGFIFAPLPLFVGVLVAFTVALRLLPLDGGATVPSTLPSTSPPWWDLPARMAIATGIVLLLTASAPLLGPQLTGLLAPFPVYATILTVFAHRQHGPAAAVGLLRGLLLGLYAFATFFLVVAVLLTPLGVTLAFIIAIVSALLVQAGSLGFMRRATHLSLR